MIHSTAQPHQPRTTRPLILAGVACAVVALMAVLGGGRLFASVTPADQRAIDAAAEVNLARFGSATQSSTGWGGQPGRAIDGNTDGNYSHGSVTHTGGDSHAYWDLAIEHKMQSVSTIDIYNRTDCCADRLNDIWVFVSDQPILGIQPDAIRNDPAVQSYRIQTAPTGERISLAVDRDTPINELYVRVQIAGSSKYLSLAEVQVWGRDGAVSTTS